MSKATNMKAMATLPPQPSQLLILLPLGTGGFMLLVSGHPKWVSEGGGEGPSYDAWQLVTRMLFFFGQKLKGLDFVSCVGQ